MSYMFLHAGCPLVVVVVDVVPTTVASVSAAGATLTVTFTATLVCFVSLGSISVPIPLPCCYSCCSSYCFYRLMGYGAFLRTFLSALLVWFCGQKNRKWAVDPQSWHVDLLSSTLTPLERGLVSGTFSNCSGFTRRRPSNVVSTWFSFFVQQISPPSLQIHARIHNRFKPGGASWTVIRTALFPMYFGKSDFLGATFGHRVLLLSLKEDLYSVVLRRSCIVEDYLLCPSRNFPRGLIQHFRASLFLCLHTCRRLFVSLLLQSRLLGA